MQVSRLGNDVSETPDEEFEEFVRRLEGPLDRSGLSRDSALDMAWSLGDDAAHRSRERRIDTARGIDRPIHTVIPRVSKLNAVARRLERSYCVALYWPLVLTLQGVAAALWANPATAPWIGDVSKLEPIAEFDEFPPPGFDLFMGLIGASEFRPEKFRSGVRIDHVDAIVRAGDDRWEQFLVTWMGSVNFAWNHELAHVLYGHADLARDRYGLDMFCEAEGDARGSISAELSQFLEHVADMDAAMQVFASFYGTSIKNEGTIGEDTARVGASTVLGILVAMYVLAQKKELDGSARSAPSTHPPLQHRAAWVLGAESQVVQIFRSRDLLREPHEHSISVVREEASRLLRSVAGTHASFYEWLAALDHAEEPMHAYLTALRGRVEPEFKVLDEYQQVGS